MSETRWTPGPWTSHGNTVESVRAHYCSTLIATTSMAPHFENAEHNARLIAAAPELYAALDMILHRYVGLVNCGDCGNWNPEEEPQVMMARAALAKARGG